MGLKRYSDGKEGEGRKQRRMQGRKNGQERKQDQMENDVHFRFGVAHIGVARWFP